MISAARDAPPPLRRIPTFLGAPVGDLEDLRPGDVAMVGLFLDHGDRGRFGKRFAARQLRYACALAGMRPPGGPAARCLDLGDLNVFPLESERQASSLRRQIGAIARAGARPVVVGGRDLPVPLADCLPEGAAPAAVPAGEAALAGSGGLALVIDLAPLLGGFAAPGAAAKLLTSVAAIPRARIAAVHLTGFAPDADVGGRGEASLAAHVLARVAAHLVGDDPCR